MSGSPGHARVACPVCGGDTHEIRAKLLCRRCGTILETCCEGGPMGGCGQFDRGGPPAESAPSAPPADSRDG